MVKPIQVVTAIFTLGFSFHSLAQIAKVPPQIGQPVSPTRDFARVLVERVVGHHVVVDHPVVISVENTLNNGGGSRGPASATESSRFEAALIATNHPGFINVSIQQMAKRMSTTLESVREPFNDFAATIMGIVRDDLDARNMLTGDFLYQAGPGLVADSNGKSNYLQSALYESNTHYDQIISQMIDPFSALKFSPGQVVPISPMQVVPNPESAGVLTSYTFMKSMVTGGTNRRAVVYTLREFMCAPPELWADSGASDARIGRDIDRFPGGDHQVFQNKCKSCHTVMDGFRGAFASFGFRQNTITNGLTNQSPANGTYGFSGTTGTPSYLKVEAKMNQNNTVFPSGYTVIDNSWINNANRPGGTNASLFQWAPGSEGGMGLRSFAKAVSDSGRFKLCMAKRVFQQACRRDPSNEEMNGWLTDLAKKFGSEDQYKLRRLYARVVSDARCLGE